MIPSGRKPNAAESSVQQEATKHMISPVRRSNDISRIFFRTPYSHVPVRRANSQSFRSSLTKRWMILWNLHPHHVIIQTYLLPRCMVPQTKLGRLEKIFPRTFPCIKVELQHRNRASPHVFLLNSTTHPFSPSPRGPLEKSSLRQVDQGACF